MPEPGKMNFGAAIEALKHGARVAREGWNGKNMWLGLQVPDSFSKMGHPYIFMCDAKGVLFPWNPNALDMLSEDWVIAPPAAFEGERKQLTPEHIKSDFPAFSLKT